MFFLWVQACFRLSMVQKVWCQGTRKISRFGMCPQKKMIRKPTMRTSFVLGKLWFSPKSFRWTTWGKHPFMGLHNFEPYEFVFSRPHQITIVHHHYIFIYKRCATAKHWSYVHVICMYIYISNDSLPLMLEPSTLESPLFKTLCPRSNCHFGNRPLHFLDKC